MRLDRMLPMTSTTTTATGTVVRGRDKYVDFIRAFSLLVVVAWHWVFTIIVWEDDGPHATNPIGFTRGIWLATWAFQVMPVFFYVGGYGHLRSWEKSQERGVNIWSFVGVRLKRLAIPTFALLGVWVVIGIIVTSVFDSDYMWRAVKLVVSPLWFMGVYLMLVLILPVALWLHKRFDSVVLVVLAGVAGLVDVIRFREDIPALGLINMVVIWGLCHQLGFFYDRIVAARRTVDWTLLFGGMFGLDGPRRQRPLPGLDGRCARRDVEHGAADDVHRGAVVLPGRDHRDHPAVGAGAAHPSWLGVDERRHQPVLVAAVPVPLDRHGAEQGVQLLVVRQRQAASRPDPRVVAAATVLVHRPAACARCR